MSQGRVEFYSRSGCHLCEQAKAELLALRAEIPFALVETDVDSNYALQEAYGLRVPVVVIEGQCICELRIDEAARASLRRALQGVR